MDVTLSMDRLQNLVAQGVACARVVDERTHERLDACRSRNAERGLRQRVELVAELDVGERIFRTAAGLRRRGHERASVAQLDADPRPAFGREAARELVVLDQGDQ